MSKSKKPKKLKNNKTKSSGITMDKSIRTLESLRETPKVSSEKILSKEKKVSKLDKIRRIQPQYFRLVCLGLVVAITAFFFLLQGMERNNVMADAVHYGYITTVLLAFIAPLVGFTAVKRYR